MKENDKKDEPVSHKVGGIVHNISKYEDGLRGTIFVAAGDPANISIGVLCRMKMPPQDKCTYKETHEQGNREGNKIRINDRFNCVKNFGASNDPLNPGYNPKKAASVFFNYYAERNRNGQPLFPVKDRIRFGEEMYAYVEMQIKSFCKDGSAEVTKSMIVNIYILNDQAPQVKFRRLKEGTPKFMPGVSVPILNTEKFFVFAEAKSFNPANLTGDKKTDSAEEVGPTPFFSQKNRFSAIPAKK
jgi:hypothetical protein